MEKVSLPIKTKIAAWWIIMIGLIGIIFYINKVLIKKGFFITHAIIESPGEFLDLAIFSILFLFSLSNFISGVYIFKKRKLAWWTAVITLVLGIISTVLLLPLSLVIIKEALIIFIILILLCVFVIPFFLLLLDRKNFWKIAT